MNYPEIPVPRPVDDSDLLLLLLQSACVAHNEAAGQHQPPLRDLHRQAAMTLNKAHADLFSIMVSIKDAEQAHADSHARPRT